jgi:hypothetical protein
MLAACRALPAAAPEGTARAQAEQQFERAALALRDVFAAYAAELNAAALPRGVRAGDVGGLLTAEFGRFLPEWSRPMYARCVRRHTRS